MADSINLIITFASGGLVGALCAWLLLPARRQHNKLRAELDQAKAALEHHRQEVDQHFLRTAELVNVMTQSYRQVHEHLADGARKLCTEEGRRLARAKSMEPLPGVAGRDGAPLQPPLDYAPSHKGTLSEDFGLAKNRGAAPFSPVDTGADQSGDSDEAVAPPRDYAEGCDAQGCPPDAELEKVRG